MRGTSTGAGAGDFIHIKSGSSACPTRAITFGDLNDPASAVSRARGDGRHYALLGDLGTRPRTTYLARVAGEGEA